MDEIIIHFSVLLVKNETQFYLICTYTSLINKQCKQSKNNTYFIYSVNIDGHFGIINYSQDVFFAFALFTKTTYANSTINSLSDSFSLVFMSVGPSEACVTGPKLFIVAV